MAIKQFTTDTTADPIVMNEIVDKINKFDLDVGDVTSLSTTEKSNVVGAINEVKAETDANGSAIGQKANPPININPDFKIWQRYNSNDATTFTNPVNKYIADRYRFNGTGTVKPVAGGAEITGTINIKYILEDADFQKLNGKTLTRSWSENGLIQKETFVCNSATIFDKTITNKTVNFVKIELGEITTPFVPRSYAEELAICQRYYNKVLITSMCPRAILQYDTIILYNRVVPMRTAPTCQFFNVQGTVQNIVSDANSEDVLGTFVQGLNTTRTFTVSYRDAPTKNIVTNTASCLAIFDAEIY